MGYSLVNLSSPVIYDVVFQYFEILGPLENNFLMVKDKFNRRRLESILATDGKHT